MNYRRTAEPASEPVTLAEMKRHLREDLVDANNDADITAMIVSARISAEELLQRTLITSTWVATLDGFPAAIRLPMPRLLSVVSIEYVDSDGASQILNSNDYTVDAMSEPGFVVPARGKAWPPTYPDINTVTVTYTAGYGAASAVPQPIKDWIKLRVGDLYEYRGETNTGNIVTPYAFVERLLDPFKVWSM